MSILFEILINHDDTNPQPYFMQITRALNFPCLTSTFKAISNSKHLEEDNFLYLNARNCLRYILLLNFNIKRNYYYYSFMKIVSMTIE